MGFTRYFELTKVPTTKMLKTIHKDVSKVFAKHKDIICYEYDRPNVPAQNELKFDKLTICFNGLGDDGHETFFFESDNLSWDFCKTAHKPYDVVVKKVLNILKKHLKGSIEVSSD